MHNAARSILEKKPFDFSVVFCYNVYIKILLKFYYFGGNYNGRLVLQTHL